MYLLNKKCMKIISGFFMLQISYDYYRNVSESYDVSMQAISLYTIELDWSFSFYI
jgi:hypothetical protein